MLTLAKKVLCGLLNRDRLDQKGLFGTYLFPTASRVMPSFWLWLWRRPLMLFLWLHGRRFWFYLRGVPRQQLVFDRGEPHIAKNVIPHNLDQLWSINSDRTEKLMNIFKSIQGLDLKKMRVLCVGPRNEAELLLLSLYGFNLKNIVAIDLFSYSPWIRLMDMHQLQFGDNEFDVVYLSYVLTYSDKIERACREILRVLRPGGFAALSFEHFSGKGVNLFGLNNLNGGLTELFGHFGDSIKHVYWQEQVPRGERVGCSAVFSVSKISVKDAALSDTQPAGALAKV